MSFNDPLSDMIARIKNAAERKRSKVSTPASKLRGRVLDVTALQWPGFLDDAFSAAERADLGLHVDDETTRFGVWAPTAQSINSIAGRRPRRSSW